MSDPVHDMFQRYYEMWTTGDTDIADELLHPDFVDHTSGPEPIRGREAFKNFVRSERVGLPDIVETPLAVIVDGDWVAALYRERGTHRGVFMDMPPSGKVIDFVGFELFRMQDGKFIEWWYANMWLETYRQLGWRLKVVDGVPGFEPRDVT